MATAFILDPIEGANHLTAFTNKAYELHRWTFVRLSFSDSQADPMRYLKQVLTAVESADVILCFGNYFWFNFCQNIPEFSKLIEQKLTSGTPFFLECAGRYRLGGACSDGRDEHQDGEDLTVRAQFGLLG
jgi:hypothetical protein